MTQLVFKKVHETVRLQNATLNGGMIKVGRKYSGVSKET